MKKSEIRKLIPLYLEGELSESEAQIVKEAITSDPILQKEAHELQRTWNLLCEVDEIEPQDDYVSHFWTELSQRESFKYRFSMFFKRHTLAKKFIPAFFMLAVVVLVGVFTLRGPVFEDVESFEIASIEQEDLELIQNFDLVENLDIIEDIEFFENFDAIESLEV